MDSGQPAASLPVFGLPGNPISSAVTFLLFASLLLKALSGSAEAGAHFALARAARTVQAKPGLTRFVPSICDFGAGAESGPSVTPVSAQSSGDLAAFARSNCFLVVPEGSEAVEAGAIARILLM
jgi:molybdopterin molybdotransferase